MDPLYSKSPDLSVNFTFKKKKGNLHSINQMCLTKYVNCGLAKLTHKSSHYTLLRRPYIVTYIYSIYPLWQNERHTRENFL